MALRYLFELDPRDGHPVARLPIDLVTRRPRRGPGLLELAEAAAVTGLGEAELVRRWVQATKDLLPEYTHDDPVAREQFLAPVEAGSDDDDAADGAARPDDPGDAGAADRRERERDPAEWTLRRVICGSLSDEHYATFRALCRARGLDPLRRDCYPRLRHNDDTGVPEVIVATTIDCMRRIAIGSGRYEGQTPPEWCGRDGAWKDVWTGDEPPHAARVGVLRAGFRGAVYKPVYWAGYAQTVVVGGREVLTEFWERMGPNQLAKCAEAASLRAAFGELLGGVYSADELMQMDNPGRRRGRRGDVSPEDQRPREELAAEPGDDWLDSEPPQTRRQFELRAIDLGLRDPRERERVITSLKRTFSALWHHEPEAFWAKAWSELRRMTARGHGLRQSDARGG